MKPRRVRSMSLMIHFSIKARILEAQSEVSKDVNTLAEMLRGLDKQFERKDDGGFYFLEQIWVPAYGNLRTLIMDEAQVIKYSIHPGSDKMYYDLRDLYCFQRRKKSYEDGRDLARLCFTTRFWQSLQKALGTQLDMSIAYHPQTDGQSKHTIQTLEDMLRACAIDIALYERKCRTPIAWAELGENKLIGPEIVQETTDKIVQIKERLKAS
ncbi:putative reverse transcriptase domain-containing protein [Tanacetum coccineum]